MQTAASDPLREASVSNRWYTYSDTTILLNLTFRAPMRDELASRCNHIAVHWTYNYGLRRTISSLSLVSGLFGTYQLKAIGTYASADGIMEMTCFDCAKRESP